MIVRTADENFPPWFLVGGIEPGPRHKNFDARRGERAQGMPRRLAQPRMISSIDAFKMPEGQGELLKVQGRQLLVWTVQGMSNSVRK
jgi:hypothetical protein